MATPIDAIRLSSKGSFGNMALGAAVLGLVGTVGAYMVDPDRFFHAFLVGFVFWVSIALGTLFFVMLHHLATARWSIVIRRIPESIMMNLPFLFIFCIPVLLGMHTLYHWSHADAVAADPLLQWKAPFLNSTFFIIRNVIYFTVWSGIAWFLYKASIAQDTRPTEEQLAGMRKTSAIGMLLFAPTVTLAAFDWLMSLDPHWYSTIFGVYFFAGSFLSSLAFVILCILFLREREKLQHMITIEHLHDLGKLMFGFVVFWSYIGFSQFFIIWYASIPEEVIFYQRRWEGSWQNVSLLLLFCHFILPFLILIFQNVKRNPMLMRIMAVWILVIHFVDLYWLVYPYYTKHLADKAGLANNEALFSWPELMPVLLLGGVFCWLFWRRIGSASLVPVGDPKLDVSIRTAN